MHTTTALQLDWLLFLKTTGRKIWVVEVLEKNNLSADSDNPHYIYFVHVCVCKSALFCCGTVNSLITVLNGYVSSSSLREAKNVSGVFTPFCQACVECLKMITHLIISVKMFGIKNENQYRLCFFPLKTIYSAHHEY